VVLVIDNNEETMQDLLKDKNGQV